MAAGKAEVRGRGSVLTFLSTPRPILRIMLVIILAVAGEIVWRLLPVPLMAYLSGVSASFCLLCAGAIWGMRDKADMLKDAEHLTVAELKGACAVSKDVRRRSTWRSAYAAFAALVAAGPAISQQFSSAVWEWMMIAGGVAIAEAAYSFLLANAWEEQLREKHDAMKVRVRELTARQALLDRLGVPAAQAAAVPSTAPVDTGWSNPVDVFSDKRH